MNACQLELKAAGKAYPRTCPSCGRSGACVKGLSHGTPVRENDAPERICPDCGSRHYARCGELREDGKHHPGSILRCVECKATYLDPALAKSDTVRALVKAAVEAERERLRAVAQAAVALVVEQAADAISPRDVYGDGRYFRVPGFHEEGCAYKDDDLVTAAEALAGLVRALAPDTGVKALAELRARAEKAEGVK